MSEPQVLIHFPDDAHFSYIYRLLLQKVSPGRWVVLTPGLELEVQDLNAPRHLVLGMHSPFPAEVADDCYVFDDLSRNELERQRKLARTMSSILDDGDIAAVAAMQWIGADPASGKFGKVVPHEILEDIVTQGSSGLVLWDNETEYVKEMPVDDVASFIGTRKESAGDLRTIGDHRDGSGKRYIDFKDGLNLLEKQHLMIGLLWVPEL